MFTINTLKGGLFTIVLLLLTRSSLHADEPLTDWSDWQTYRTIVTHPATTIKPDDLKRAHENIQRYAWARKQRDAIVNRAEAYLKGLSSEFVERMIPETTPGEILFTPCPSSRDQNRSFHPHGQWTWSVDKPDQIVCKVCEVVFPNDEHAETMSIETTWGIPQRLTFYGGDPFILFSYKTARPSFTGNVRARKVEYMANTCQILAEAYALTGDHRYAASVRMILNRFAATYRHWLVHSGYGEYADMDPHIAASRINNLPRPERVVPPNKPDGKLHTGYWTAGRARAVGLPGRFVAQVTKAYDLTVTATDATGNNIYSDSERITIERDLLLEGTVLLTADTQLNNKSVTNLTAAALVGMCVGEPALVRFGVKGFHKAVHDWFLPDGSTPESPAYAMMTLSGLVDLSQAFRDYSDPSGYHDSDGERIDNLTLYHDTSYAYVWRRMYQTLQGDLRYPPFADSYSRTAISAGFADLLAANYPTQSEYLALLKERCGPDLSMGSGSVSLYYRMPGLENRETSTFKLPDVCPPELRIGFMRSGDNGRDSLLLLSASHWGGHHHLDSLNLYYWKDGHELLSDLGYLWDHPKKTMLSRSFAHNLVILDGKDQITRGRGGEVHFFKTSPHVKMMKASSNAYTFADRYERTALLIDHGSGRSYAVDFFNVHGGTTQDYVYHGPNADYHIYDLDLQPRETSRSREPIAFQQHYDLTNPRTGIAPGVWRSVWQINDSLSFSAWNLGDTTEQVIVADGWGQRDHRGSDEGRTLPYIIRRTQISKPRHFISLFEGHDPASPFVHDIKRVPITSPKDSDAVALQVDTAIGRDYILCNPAAPPVTIQTPDGQIRFTSHTAAVSIENDKVIFSITDNDNTVTIGK